MSKSYLYVYRMCFEGTSVGTAVTYIVCGYLMDWLGWESVFYITGSIGLLWHICWTYLVYDSPRIHPTITEKELKYIENSLGNSIVKNVSVSYYYHVFNYSYPYSIYVSLIF